MPFLYTFDPSGVRAVVPMPFLYTFHPSGVRDAVSTVAHYTLTRRLAGRPGEVHNIWPLVCIGKTPAGMKRVIEGLAVGSAF
jgi:hypothetical protein